MKTQTKTKRKLVKSLDNLRAEHQVLLSKVEKTRAKLDKRQRKLQRLETRIATLERRAAEPQKRKLGQAAAKDDHLRRARLIVNPSSGTDNTDNSKRLVQIIGCLREHGILAGIDFKTSGKAARELAKEAVDNGEELVIVAGGDGTIEDVASQLIGTKTTLGIIPVGTMNNLARSLGIPVKIDDAAALIGMSAARKIDVGRVVSKEKPETEFFLEGAGIGLSAIVIPAGHALEKKRWKVMPDTIRKLFDSQPEPIQVELDNGQVVTASSQVVTVSNAPLIGKNIMIAPEAKMDDGLLDIAVYEDMGKTELLRYFASATNGNRAQDPRVKFYKSKTVRIKSSKEVEANSDKDVIPAKRVFEIELLPHALSVIVGNGIGLTLPVQAAPHVPPVGAPQETKEESPLSENGNRVMEKVDEAR